MRVSDHVPGLATQELLHVFKRSYKTDAARTRSCGSGLELRSRGEVSLQAGTITAANRPTGGAAFTVLLPQPTPPV